MHRHSVRTWCKVLSFFHLDCTLHCCWKILRQVAGMRVCVFVWKNSSLSLYTYVQPTDKLKRKSLSHIIYSLRLTQMKTTTSLALLKVQHFFISTKDKINSEHDFWSVSALFDKGSTDVLVFTNTHTHSIRLLLLQPTKSMLKCINIIYLCVFVYVGISIFVFQLSCLLYRVRKY